MMRFVALVFAGVVFLCAGCGPMRDGDPADFIKPTIAVMKFENRAPFPLGWNLGDGMADILVDRLLATKRYRVIERAEIDHILGELQLQQSGVTRGDSRAKLGRIKNVRYLIKGVVTDFGHVSSTTARFGSPVLGLFGSRAAAVVGMTLYVVDVESGEVICSESIEKSVSAKSAGVAGQYKGVSLGGSVFHRTPLGRATAAVMTRAVRKITATIASQPWQTKIAQVMPDNTVFLNGGRNRRITIGSEYHVLSPGRAIVDPDTGDIIGHHSIEILARLRVRRVQARFSVAELIEGDGRQLKVGQTCRRLGRPTAGPPASTSSARSSGRKTSKRAHEFPDHH